MSYHSSQAQKLIRISRFPSMFASVGVAASSGIGAGLMVGVSVIPTLLVHWKGRSWRKVHQDTTL